MSDLVSEFYQRDLSAAEMDELESLLEASPVEAERFYRLAEADGRAWGLRAPEPAKAAPKRAWGWSWRLAWMPALALALGMWILTRPGPPKPWTDTLQSDGQGITRGGSPLRESGYEVFSGRVAGLIFERWDLYQGEARVGRRYRAYNSTPNSMKVKLRVLAQSQAMDRLRAPDLPDGWISVGPYRRVELGGMDAAQAGQAWAFEIEILDQAIVGATP